MGIHSYDETYLDTVASNLGTMFEYTNSIDVDQVKFWNNFTTSYVSKQIESGNPKYLAGLSAIDLLNEVINSNQGFIEPDSFDTPTRYYWAGWALAQLQFHKAISFYEINKYLPIEKVLSLYDTLHEADITKFIEVSNFYFDNINKETNFLYSNIDKWGWLVDFIKTVADSSNKSAWNSFENYESQGGLNSANSNYIYSIAYELRAFIGGFKYEKSSYFPTQDYSKSDVENKLWNYIPKSTYTIVDDNIDLTNKIYQPIKEGYAFVHWCSDSQLNNPIFTIRCDSYRSIVLYANWEKITKYTFEPNGGELDYCVYESVNSAVFDLIFVSST